MEGASSSAGSAPTTPAAQMDLDPLAQDEYAAFGVNPAEESLPLPPNASVGNAGVGSLSKRTLDAALPAAPLGRAKRPKNVKFRLVHLCARGTERVLTVPCWLQSC